DGASDGPREWATATTGTPPTPPDRGNHARGSALRLEADTVVEGRVQRGGTEDWYAVTVPQGHRTLRLHLAGVPWLGATAELLATDGTVLPLATGPGPDG